MSAAAPGRSRPCWSGGITHRLRKAHRRHHETAGHGGRVRARNVQTARDGRRAGLANILDREFDGYGQRAHLAGDLTYVRVGGEWAYACRFIGLANRGIAGHGAGARATPPAWSWPRSPRSASP